MLGCGVREPFLIDTDPAHPVETLRVVDRWVGVLGDRSVGGMPADPELDGCSSDRETRRCSPCPPIGPGPVRSATPAWRSHQRLRTMCSPRTTLPRNAIGDERTPTLLAHLRSADPAPPCAPGRGRSPARRSSGTTPDPRRSPPTATTRRRAAPARRRRVRPYRRARSRRLYRETWTRVSPSADSQMPAEWRGPWPRWWIPISEARTSHRPAPQRAEPVIPLARQDIVPRWSAAASCQA